MTKLQRKVLDLLLEIDSICRENDIEYYLAAGSSIGAVRHHGFLPWDDDADIYMTYTNWEKFRKLADQLPDDRELITVDNGDYTCEYTVNRYADISTTRLYRYLCSSPQPAGISVDIIVLDPVPNNEADIRQHVKDLTEYSDYLIVACAHGTRCPFPLDDELIIKMGEKLGRKEMLDELKQRSERYKNTEGGVLIQRDPTVPHVWKESTFGKPQYVRFEDTELPIAAKPYLQLTGAFNEDWMYVPDSVNREEHIKGVIFDISSNNSMDDYLGSIDREKVRSQMVELTRKTNLLAPLNKEQNRKRLSLAGAKVKLKYKRNNTSIATLKKWTAGRDHERLDEYFREYEIMQGDKRMIGGVAVKDWLMSQEPYYIDISDEFLYYFLRNYMHRPNLGKARVIVQGRINEREPNDLIIEVQSLIEACNDLSDRIEQKDYEGIIDELKLLHRRYPENLRILQLYFACRYYLARTDEDYTSLREEIENLPECDRNEAVVQCIHAEVLEKQGRQEEALELYDLITKTSTHGLVLLHIKEKLEKYDDEYCQSIVKQAVIKLGSPVDDFEDEESDEFDEADDTEEES